MQKIQSFLIYCILSVSANMFCGDVSSFNDKLSDYGRSLFLGALEYGDCSLPVDVGGEKTSETDLLAQDIGRMIAELESAKVAGAKIALRSLAAEVSLSAERSRLDYDVLRKTYSDNFSSSRISAMTVPTFFEMTLDEFLVISQAELSRRSDLMVAGAQRVGNEALLSDLRQIRYVTGTEAGLENFKAFLQGKDVVEKFRDDVERPDRILAAELAVMELRLKLADRECAVMVGN